MAIKNRWKAKFDEAVDYVQDKASDVTSSIRNVVRQPVHNTSEQSKASFQRFQQNFNEGYKSFVAQQQQEAEEKQRAFNDFTNRVVNTVRSPETPKNILKLADKTAEVVSPGYKTGKITLRKGKEAIDSLEKYVPGGYEAGLERVKQGVVKDPGSLWIGRGFAEAPESARIVGKALGNEQIGEDIGYGIRGASNLTPFNPRLGGEQTRKVDDALAPTTERQQRAKDIGQAVYGTLLTAPIGGGGTAAGMIRAVGSRALQGTTLGLAMTTASSLMTQGRLPTQDELIEGGINGLENSWQLAFTNALTNKVLSGSKLTSGLTDKSIDQAFNLLGNASKMNLSNVVKSQLLAKGLKSLFLRSLAEVPAENTLWTLVDQLDGDAQEDFITEWMKNLPGNVLGNVAFGMASGGVRGAWNYKQADIQSAIDAAQKTVKTMMKDQRGYIKPDEFIPDSLKTDTQKVDTTIDDGVTPKVETPEEVDPTKLIQEDLAKNIEEQKIMEENPQPEAKTPEDIVKEQFDAEAQNKLFGSETIEQVKTEIDTGEKVLQDMRADFQKARELRTKRKDFNSLKDRIKSAWSDRFWEAQKTDQDLYTNLRLLGGEDTRTAAIISRAVGPLINREAKAGRGEDFSILLGLDRMNELVQRGLSRKYNQEQIDMGLRALEAKYSPEEMMEMKQSAQELRGFLSYLLEQAVKSGLISEDAAKAARENNEFYITFEAIGQLQRDVDAKSWLDGNTGVSGKSFNVAKQEVLRTIGDSESGIADPIESTLSYMSRTIQNMDKNSILKDFVERRMNDGSEVAIPLRQAENVRERMRINSEIGEMKPIQRKLQRLIRTRSKWVRQLQNELGKLNLQGLNLALKPQDDINVNPTRLERVLEGKVLKLNKLDDELNELNLEGLGISLQRQPKVAEPTEYFRKTGGRFASGKDQYTKVVIPPRIKAVIDQMVVMPESELKALQGKIQTREGKASDLVEEILDIKDQLRMQKFVDSLVSLPSSEMNKIKRKIETREGKVVGVLDDIAKLSEDLEGVKDELIQLRTERGEIKDVQDVPVGYGVINVFRDGIKEEWAVPKELEIAIKNLDAKSSGWLVDSVLQPANQLFKQAVTSKNPVFVLLVNPIKDIQNALFAESTEKGLKQAGEIGWNYLGALSDAARLSNQRERWAIAGSGQSGFLAQEMKVDPTKAVADLQKRGGFNTKVKETVTSPLKLLDYLSRTTEETTRLAKFNKDYAKLSPEMKAALDDPYIPLAQLPKEVRQIALESRNITQDFSRMGTAAQQVNKIIPFFNPALQGTLRLGALAKDNPARFVQSAIVLTAIPALVAYMNNRQYEDYQDLREYEKRGNLIWITKDRTPEEIEAGAPLHAVKLPLGQITAPFYNIAEQFYEFVDSDEPDALQRFAHDVGVSGLTSLAEMSPVGDLSSVTPPLLKIPTQLWANKDMYSGMPIEPDYIDTDGDGSGDTPREEVPSAYRTGYYTGPTTEILGRLTGPTIGLSPAQLDSIIYSALGGSGKTILAATDTLLGEPPELKRNPILSRFTAPRGGQLQQEEYDLEKEEQKRIQEETFGSGINFDGISFAKEADASSGSTPVIKNGDRPLPETTEELEVLYDDAEKTMKGYAEKKTKIQYGDYKSETKRKKDLNELEKEYQGALELKSLIEQRYPQQVYEIGLSVYGKGSEQGVEKRAEWAYNQFQTAKSPEEFEKMVNEMWEKGVLTKNSNGVASFIKEVYGIDVSRYTGDDPATKKSVGSGSGGKKPGKLSVNIPKLDLPKLNIANSPYGKGSAELFKPIQVDSGYGKIKLNVPKAERITLPKRTKISADIAPMRTSIRGL